MREDARQNRARILAAAEAVFAEHGEAGSTEEVARRAGVGIATVFRHFPTKRALIEAALAAHFEALTGRARALAATTDPGAALRDLVRVMIETGSTKLALASLVGGLAPPAVAASSRGLREEVGDILRRAQDAGAVRPAVTVDELYLLIRGLAQATAAAPPSPETLRGAVAIVLAGLAP